MVDLIVDINQLGLRFRFKWISIHKCVVSLMLEKNLV